MHTSSIGRHASPSSRCWKLQDILAADDRNCARQIALIRWLKRSCNDHYLTTLPRARTLSEVRTRISIAQDAWLSKRPREHAVGHVMPVMEQEMQWHLDISILAGWAAVFIRRWPGIRSNCPSKGERKERKVMLCENTSALLPRRSDSNMFIVVQDWHYSRCAQLYGLWSVSLL